MGIFFNSKNKKELALVFDIGSSSVGGAVFEIEKNGIPKIILSIREPIILENKIDIDQFLSLALKSLESVAKRISTMGVGKLKNISCVLSSPWYASQTRIIKLEKNTPFVFTSKLADSLIEKEMSLFTEENLAKFAEDNNKTRLIEFKNMKTTLNGYVTSNPLNKKIKKLEMTIFISMSIDRILKKMEETILQHFHTEQIKFSSFAMASFTVARDIFVHKEDFLLVDIAGEVTDISMVKKDVLVNSISYPLGYNFIVRKLAENLNCDLNEAKSLISLYKNGHAEENVEKKLEPVVSKLKIEWLSKFQESLTNLSDDISVPATIFITVDQDLTDFFSKIIKSDQFNRYTLTEPEFQIIFLDVNILNGITSFKEDTDRDPFMIIESIYLNRFIC